MRISGATLAPLECPHLYAMSFTATFVVVAPTQVRASSAFRPRAVPALRSSAFTKSVSTRKSVKTSASYQGPDQEITPMMLTTAALGALGSACSVVLLASTVEATSVVAATAAGLAEAEEIAMTMEYSSRVTSGTRLASAPAVDMDTQDHKTGQELFECDIQSLRCVT